MRKQSIVIGIVIICFFALSGGVVWYVLEGRGISSKWQADEQPSEQPQVDDNQPVQDVASEINPPAGGQQSETINTDDWLTYRNEEYGFEVRYPEEWIVNEENNSMYFTRDISVEQASKGELGTPLSIKVLNKKFSSLEQWFADQFSDKSQEMTPEFSWFQTAADKGIRYTDPLSMGGCDENYVVLNNQRLYQLYRHGSTCDYSNDLFMEIIESLKFD